MKTIWILNHYATNQFLEHGGRHYSFAKYLMRAGYAVRIFCARTVHNSDQAIDAGDDLYTEDACDGIPFVFIKARQYKGNGKQRVLNMLDFYINVQKAAKHFEMPDVIIGSSVHPLACVAAIKLSKRYGCRNIVEIRDLWPESIVALDYAKKSNPIVILLNRLEKWIYTKADSIIFTMEGGRDYIIEKGWDGEHGGPIELSKVHYINNGVDLEMFDYNREHYRFYDADLENPETFIVAYTGSMRAANNIDLLIDAAKLIKNEKIRFLIYGKSDQAVRLQQRVQNEEIENVVFKGSVEKKYIPYVLSKSNLNVLNYDSNVAKLLKYGGSQNKLFEYLASGKPIVSNIKTNYSIVRKHSCGIECSTNTSEAYVDAINMVAEMPKVEYDVFSTNALKAAKEYDFQVLANKLISILGEQK